MTELDLVYSCLICKTGVMIFSYTLILALILQSLLTGGSSSVMYRVKVTASARHKLTHTVLCYQRSPLPFWLSRYETNSTFCIIATKTFPIYRGFSKLLLIVWLLSTDNILLHERFSFSACRLFKS